MSTICDGCGEYMGDCECEAAALSSRTNLLRGTMAVLPTAIELLRSAGYECTANKVDALAARIRKELGDE